MHILDIVHVFDIIEKIILAYMMKILHIAIWKHEDSENGVLSLLPIDGALGQAPQRNFSLPT